LLLHLLPAIVVVVAMEEVSVAADGLLGAGVDGELGRAVRRLTDSGGAAAGPAFEPAGRASAGFRVGVGVLGELVQERLERPGAAAAGLGAGGGEIDVVVVLGVGVGVGVGRHPGRRLDGAARGRVPERSRALEREEVAHQRRGRHGRRAPPPARRRRASRSPVTVRVPVVVAEVDAVGEVRVAAEVAPRTPAPRRGTVGRRHCGAAPRLVSVFPSTHPLPCPY